MLKNIEPKLKKVGEYLKLDENAIFSIPEYQRAYSWEIGHCDKLWQDVNDYIDEGNRSRYFFGTIMINCQENDTIFSLIDGQQRTTTFMLLLKALLIRINNAIETTSHDEDSESLCLGLKERRRNIMMMLYKLEAEDISDKPNIAKDQELYKNVVVLENNSINELYKGEFQTILSAIDYTEAESKVTKIPRKQKDNKYTNFFKNFKFFYEKASELSDSELNKFAKTFTDECVVIEIKSWQVEQAITMFNSLNSDGMPLLDADIIAAKLYAVAEGNNVQGDFSTSWKSLIELIEELKQSNIADIDDILNQQMYYERAIRRELVSESGAVILTTPGLRRYYTEINKELLNDPIGLCTKITNLANIWKKVSTYPSVQVLLKFNSNAKLFIASYFHRFKSEEITEEFTEEMVVCLLRLFTVLELVDVGYSSSRFKSFLFGEIEKMANPNIPVCDIKSDFDNHILREWGYEDIKERISDYDDNILVYLNELLFSKEKSLSFSLNSSYDIEHIMPASGANLEEIRRDAQISTEEEFRSIVNKLGNKILLEEKINRSIGNEWFRSKVSNSVSEKKGYKDSKFPIASTLVTDYATVNKPYWTKSDIEGATSTIAKRIANFIFDRKEDEENQNAKQN